MNFLGLKNAVFLSQNVDGNVIFTWSFLAFHDISEPGRYGFLRGERTSLSTMNQKYLATTFENIWGRQSSEQFLNFFLIALTLKEFKIFKKFSNHSLWIFLKIWKGQALKLDKFSSILFLRRKKFHLPFNANEITTTITGTAITLKIFEARNNLSVLNLYLISLTFLCISEKKYKASMS